MVVVALSRVVAPCDTDPPVFLEEDGEDEEFLMVEAIAASFLPLPVPIAELDLADDIPLPAANPPVGLAVRAVVPPYLAAGR